MIFLFFSFPLPPLQILYHQLFIVIRPASAMKYLFQFKVQIRQLCTAALCFIILFSTIAIIFFQIQYGSILNTTAKATKTAVTQFEWMHTFVNTSAHTPTLWRVKWMNGGNIVGHNLWLRLKTFLTIILF